MKLLKIILNLSFLLLLYNCADYKLKKSKTDFNKKFYSSKGFALIYSDNLYDDGILKKKIDNNIVVAKHSILKKNTMVSIINPINSKEVTIKINENIDYPKIFNIMISQEIAKLLELDEKNPYVEIFEIKMNETFVAKEGTMFEEEKNVALKAPVEKIEVNDLTKVSLNKKSKQNKDIKNKFLLVVGDFYYQETALNLKNELTSKNDLKDISIKKVKQNQYRLFVGPFKNFNTLKVAYISLNKIGFEDLNIIRE